MTPIFPADVGATPKSQTRPDGRVHAFPSRAGVVKVCGLREPAHAETAAAAGADLVGFIFASARRQVRAVDARRCIAAARAAAGARPVLAVGVFVDATADEMNAVADVAGLDLLQLHGGEPAAMLGTLTRPVVKVLRPRPGTPPALVEAVAARYHAAMNPPLAFLVDAFAADAAGGTGHPADWRLAADLAARWPVILAGGLDPGNVAGAIAAVRPLGVDVSSGVETDGVKDAAKIAAFVAAARCALDGKPPRSPEHGA